MQRIPTHSHPKASPFDHASLFDALGTLYMTRSYGVI